MKKEYIKPRIKTVEFKVELGLTLSVTGNVGGSEAETYWNANPSSDGTESYSYRTTYF